MTMKPGKGRNNMYSVMANSGKWSKVVIIRPAYKNIEESTDNSTDNSTETNLCINSKKAYAQSN